MELTPRHRPSREYVRELRSKLNRDFPGVTFYAVPVDIVSQILNFGVPAPIDIQVVGRKLSANHAFAEKLMNQLKFVPGAVDLRIQRPFNYPKIHVIEVDRTKASQVGFTQLDAATNLLVTLSGQLPDLAFVLKLDPSFRSKLYDRDANPSIQSEFPARS